jgi:hypothetical protein
MNLGFTGTREGMSQRQKLALGELLDGRYSMNIGDFHHGDCQGADTQAHLIAKSRGWNIIIHPPDQTYARAYNTGFSSIRMPMPFLARNHNIVDECSALIAAPRTEKEELRSGTWATIRYAWKQGKTVVILNP